MGVSDFAFLTNAASTLVLTGLIWTVQLVHYPAFRYVAPDRFVDFETFHRRGISLIVMPLMLLELESSLVLLLYPAPLLPWWWAAVGAAAVSVIWLSTFLIQVPLHQTLASGYDQSAIERLVRTNWIRTVVWSVRAGWVLVALWTLFATADPGP